MRKRFNKDGVKNVVIVKCRMDVPLWLQAGLWGLLAGGALVIGALIAYYFQIRTKIIAMIMAFGSGVLISALSFNLMDEAYKTGGILSTAGGFLGGASIYTFINYILSRNGAKHRKRSGNQQPKKGEPGSGLALAAGALIDGIPESIAIGLSMLKGGKVGLITVIAIFLSNIPEGLSSAAGMKKAGRTPFFIFGIWFTIAVISGLSSIAGYTLFQNLSVSIVGASIAIAAGAILAMIVDTMIPEAFQEAHDFAGLITVFGFLIAFFLTKF